MNDNTYGPVKSLLGFFKSQFILHCIWFLLTELYCLNVLLQDDSLWSKTGNDQNIMSLLKTSCLFS